MVTATALGPNPAAGNDAVTHPHVQGGSICLGEGTYLLSAALTEGRLYDAFLIVCQVLQTYNDASPYVSLDHWQARLCDECDARVNDEDLYRRQRCGTSLCGDCEHTCADCHDSFCRRCLDMADDGDLLCSSCLESRPQVSDDTDDDEIDEPDEALDPSGTDVPVPQPLLFPLTGVLVLMLTVALGMVLMTVWSSDPIVVRLTDDLTVERVRSLATLVTTAVQVSDRVEVSCAGYARDVTAEYDAHGTVWLSPDLSHASIVDREDEGRAAVFTTSIDLGSSRLRSPRFTRLWYVFPSDSLRLQTEQRAMEKAQERQSQLALTHSSPVADSLLKKRLVGSADRSGRRSLFAGIRKAPVCRRRAFPRPSLPE